MARRCLILLALLFAFTGYAQNIRVGALTVTGGANVSGGATTTVLRATSHATHVAGTTNLGTIATSQEAPVVIHGSFAFPPVTNANPWVVTVTTNTLQRNVGATNGTVTFSGTAVDGVRVEYHKINTATTNYDITIPSSLSIAQALSAVTTVTVKSNSLAKLIWVRISGAWYLDVVQEDDYSGPGTTGAVIGKIPKITAVSPKIVVGWADDDSAAPASGDAAKVNETAISDSFSLTNTTASATAAGTTWNVTGAADPDPDKVSVVIGAASATVAGIVTAQAQAVAGIKSLTQGATDSGELRFVEDTDNGANYVALKPAASLAGDTTATLPAVTGLIALHTTITNIVEFAFGETNVIATGTGLFKWRAPHAMTIVGLRASLSTASSSGIPTVDINEAGTTIISTKLTIDANETTSTTAANAFVLSDTAIADDAELTLDVDVAGTGAAGLKVKIYYTR